MYFSVELEYQLARANRVSTYMYIATPPRPIAHIAPHADQLKLHHAGVMQLEARETLNAGRIGRKLPPPPVIEGQPRQEPKS